MGGPPYCANSGLANASAAIARTNFKVYSFALCTETGPEASIASLTLRFPACQVDQGWYRMVLGSNPVTGFDVPRPRSWAAWTALPVTGLRGIHCVVPLTRVSLQSTRGGTKRIASRSEERRVGKGRGWQEWT